MLIVSPPSASDVHKQVSDHLTISSSCLTCSLLRLMLCYLYRAYISDVCSLLG